MPGAEPLGEPPGEFSWGEGFQVLQFVKNEPETPKTVSIVVHLF